MTSHSAARLSRYTIPGHLHPRVCTHCRMHTEFPYEFPSEKLTRVILSISARIVAAPHDSTLTPRLPRRGNSGITRARGVCEGELAACHAIEFSNGISTEFYCPARLARLPARIMRRHEPLVSGKSIEHIEGRRSSALGDFFRLAGPQSRIRARTRFSTNRLKRHSMSAPPLRQASG